MANEQQLEEGQIVLCTVEKILGITVFVKIQENGEGTITTSEISPGRIRNLRDYVVPGKKIVCKILSIDNRGIHLSLRRVKQTEKKELLDKINKERGYKSILKTALREQSEKVIEKITSEQTILDFFEQVKQDSKILEDYLSKEDSEKVLKILELKKEKPKEIRKIFKLSSKSSNGIGVVKNIIQDSCNHHKCDTNHISYLAAGKYRLSLKGENFKALKTEMNKVLEEIEKQAKKQNCEFSIEKD